MKKYARIENGAVAELIEIDDALNIADMFHPMFIWVPATDAAQVGDEYNGGVFQRQAAPARNVQAEIDALERDSMTNRGARELQLAIMRQQGAEQGLQTDEAIAGKVIYFAKLLALDTQIRALRALL